MEEKGTHDDIDCSTGTQVHHTEKELQDNIWHSGGERHIGRMAYRKKDLVKIKDFYLNLRGKSIAIIEILII